MKNMTTGSISRHLLSFAVPMVLGNLLQLTYNAVDSMIIGKCLGENALAAVSTSAPIITIVVLGVSGLSIGVSVIMSRFFGEGNLERTRREFSTGMTMGLVFSLAVFLLGMLFSRQMLTLIQSPKEILADAEAYLRFMFLGFLFTFQYNLHSAALRALGESAAPVRFLGISCVLNILLDVLFVMFLHLGVRGAALATVISEAFSVLLCALHIRRHLPFLRLRSGDLIPDRKLLGETLQLGSLTALQQAAQPVGKLLIQSFINLQGITAIGAFNAVSRLDDFARIPTQSIGSAIMTCTAQNRGARSPERCRLTLRQGLIIACLYAPLIFSVVQLLKRPAVSLLIPDGHTQMLESGVAYLTVKAWFFIHPCITNAIQGFFRGMGNMTLVLICTLIQITLRTLFSAWLIPVMGITGEAYACMIGWTVMMIVEFTVYFRTRRRMYAQMVRQS